MPRPTTKEELITAANGQFEKLQKLIDDMSEEERTADINPNERDKNVRDVLVHLYEWHCLLLRWIEANTHGTPADFLPAPYNWKTYPEMNIEFWKKHQHTSYAESEQLLTQSHPNVMNVIDHFSNEELFTKKHFNWTGTTTLGSYCVSATSSHYDWAMKDIKKALKKYRGK